tara:strand:- start:50 stop:511 length:462 start_codon:yes stop_codon:yes gene_type:complete
MSNNDRKWASSDKDRLLVENFKKFMEEEDFRPIAEEKAKQVKDFIKDEYKKYSTVPIGVLTRVIIKHRKDLEEMAKEEGIKKIARLMNNFKEDAGLVKKLRGEPLQNIMEVSLAGFVEWYLNKEEQNGNKLVNFKADETGDEMSDEELYKDIF